MDYGDFIVMLARQRSGTNPLRSVLNTHADVFCVPEVFNNRPSPDFKLEVATNYVRFVESQVGGDLRAALSLDDHRALFVEFLEYLRCFSDSRYVLIDVKYNASHHVSQFWRFITEEPLLFALAKELGIRILNLTRPNFLRYYLSETKAHLTKRWEAFDEAVVGQTDWYRERFGDGGSPESQAGDQKVRLDVADLTATLELCQSENQFVERSFAGYHLYEEVQYEQMFPRIGAPLSDLVLERLSGWLDIEPVFGERRPQYRKQSDLPLWETVANFDEVKAALTGTDFEYCLEDEAMYRSPPVAVSS